MPVRSFVAEPEQLVKLAAAFDSAWLGVNSVQTVGAQSQNRARVRLAEIILQLWREDPTQPLGARAVERFLASEPPPDA